MRVTLDGHGHYRRSAHPGNASTTSAKQSRMGRKSTFKASHWGGRCPHTFNNEGVIASPISRLHAASSPAVYASRRALPHAM